MLRASQVSVRVLTLTIRMVQVMVFTPPPTDSFPRPKVLMPLSRPSKGLNSMLRLERMRLSLLEWIPALVGCGVRCLACVIRVQGFGCVGFRVSGFGFRISVFGFRASVFGLIIEFLRLQFSVLGFRVSGWWFRVSGFVVSGFGFRVQGLWSVIEGVGLRVQGQGRKGHRKIMVTGELRSPRSMP